MPAQDPLNGFAGDTVIFTTWGACKLHDLARLSASRDAAALSWAGCIAEHEAYTADALADFDANTAPLLDAGVAQAQRAELAAALAAVLSELQASRDLDLAVRLPEIVIDADTSTPCVGVERVGETSEIIRVVISQVQVGEPPQNVDVVVRCGAAASFVTADGPVLAADIDGAPLSLYLGGTFNASASVEASEASVPLYRVSCASEVYCAGADSAVAVLVNTLA